VSLLLDENLSPRLLKRLSALFPRLIHVRDAGLRQASDETIWEWARRNSFTIVTTDADFAGLSRRLGWPPKVIHFEQCDYPFRIMVPSGRVMRTGGTFTPGLGASASTAGNRTARTRDRRLRWAAFRQHFSLMSAR
jgi:predicted nuclease of predicted toxin-antitoxin system